MSLNPSELVQCAFDELGRCVPEIEAWFQNHLVPTFAGYGYACSTIAMRRRQMGPRGVWSRSGPSTLVLENLLHTRSRQWSISIGSHNFFQRRKPSSRRVLGRREL
jgi:hypothetical protein